MEFEQFSFNHSDSNFAEISYDGSKVANQALAETDKIYAAAYERANKTLLQMQRLDLVTFKSLVSL